MYRVSYMHMKGYRVARGFDTREGAQEFIDVNALVWPLPGARLIVPDAEALRRELAGVYGVPAIRAAFIVEQVAAEGVCPFIKGGRQYAATAVKSGGFAVLAERDMAEEM